MEEEKKMIKKFDTPSIRYEGKYMIYSPPQYGHFDRTDGDEKTVTLKPPCIKRIDFIICRDQNNFCHNHMAKGHNTNDCKSPKRGNQITYQKRPHIKRGGLYIMQTITTTATKTFTNTLITAEILLAEQCTINVILDMFEAGNKLNRS